MHGSIVFCSACSVQCRRKESSRSLSHLLVSFFVNVRGVNKQRRKEKNDPCFAHRPICFLARFVHVETFFAVAAVCNWLIFRPLALRTAVLYRPRASPTNYVTGKC